MLCNVYGYKTRFILPWYCAHSNNVNTRLGEVDTAGRTCVKILSPMELVMKALAAVAEKINAVLQPITDMINSVNAFIVKLIDAAVRFAHKLMDNDAVKVRLLLPTMNQSLFLTTLA